MQQRQLRLGDILDDYCPRERRLTNHAVVAMIGDAVRLTRCTTCDAEHDYKHAKQPRQRKKRDPAALSAPVAPPAPKRVAPETPVPEPDSFDAQRTAGPDEVLAPLEAVPGTAASDVAESVDEDASEPAEEGPVHRQLIRAQLPRHEGQPPAQRQAPDFTIRQPAGRQNRFRPRQQRGAGGAMFQGSGGRPNSNLAGNSRGGAPRPSGRPPMTSRLPKRQGPPHKRSK